MDDKGWIDEELFEKIRVLMPIAAVDILAVHEGARVQKIRYA